MNFRARGRLRDGGAADVRWPGVLPDEPGT